MLAFDLFRKIDDFFHLVSQCFSQALEKLKSEFNVVSFGKIEILEFDSLLSAERFRDFYDRGKRGHFTEVVKAADWNHHSSASIPAATAKISFLESQQLDGQISEDQRTFAGKHFRL